jgi:hypothetical protein
MRHEPLTDVQEQHVSSLLKHPGWPIIEEMLFRDIRELLDLSLVIRSECSAGVQSALTKLGLDVPTNQEEQLRVYLAMRAVIVYMTEKKKQVDALRQLQEERTREGIEKGHLTPEAQTTLRGN